MDLEYNSRFLRIPVTQLRGVGAWYAKRLAKLGILTVRDLLWHFPIRYEDFTNVKKIGEARIGETCSIVANVKKIGNRKTWKRRMFVTEAIVEDETGMLPVIWFNQPFLTRNIPQGALVSLSGKITQGDKGIYLSSPAYEVIERSPKPSIEISNSPASSEFDRWRAKFEIPRFRHTARLIPVYPETRGVTSRALRFLIQPLIPGASRIPDMLPPQTIERTRLMGFGKAIREIHFPATAASAAEARRRFAFDTIFLIQLLLQELRSKNRHFKAPVIPPDIPLIRRFVASLPFELTNAQRKSAWEILQDMAKPTPMNRLLNGDVGSGKTVVATIAALQTSTAGHQAVILAPTEILARQHFQKISQALAKFPVKLALLVAKESLYAEEGLSSKIRKDTLLRRLRENMPVVVIGTHALLQEDVRFGKLGLVVVDEQHRFGVEQRSKLLKERALMPHLLSMTATPIPRTLALSLYGDLDISILDELPKGRQKIVTRIISPKARSSAYQFIRNQVKERRQVFVICPRIDPVEHERETKDAFYAESGDWRVEVKAVTTEHEKLSKTVFPDLRVAMLHGRMKSQDKDAVMKRFASGGTDILVSTSVVEVGVDVPNATVMMIDGAEHFGLSQLHQFRGRVGRGKHQSYCLLFTESNTRAALSRLKALAELDDGFALAEKDLEFRGPGQFFGKEQSGLPDLAMRSLTDLPLLQLARREAKYLLDNDPELKNAPLLKERLDEFRKKVHLE